MTEVANSKTRTKSHLCNLFGGKTRSERTCGFSRLLSHGPDSCDALTVETVVCQSMGVVSTHGARSHTLRTPCQLPKSKELWIRIRYIHLWKPQSKALIHKTPLGTQQFSECCLQIPKTRAEGPHTATYSCAELSFFFVTPLPRHWREVHKHGRPRG